MGLRLNFTSLLVNRILSLFLLLAAAIASGGCAGPNGTAKDDGEYEWVRPTGSNIAVKVRKGESAAVTTSPTGQVSGDQAAGILNSAGGKVPTDTGK